MLKKIDYIKNLGIFSEYKSEPTLPEFRKFNVIYGANGTGKTTLARFLCSLSTLPHSEYLELQYRIASDNDPEAFTAVAKTISEAISGSVTRTYRKNNAEDDYYKNKIELTTPTELERDICRLILQQEQLPNIEPFALPTMVINGNSFGIADALEHTLHLAIVACGKTAITSVIDRLKQYPDIARWTETGLALYERYHSDTCEFCSGEISNKRIEDLKKHFNAEDQALKNELASIQTALKEIDDQFSIFKLPDSANLYAELRTLYQSYRDTFNLCAKDLRHSIAVALDALAKKSMTETRSTPLI